MPTSDKIKALLMLSGKKQMELAEHFGMSRQTMNNKFGRDSWSAKDLVKVADFCGCSVGFVLPDGQHIFLEKEATEDSGNCAINDACKQ